MIGKIGIAALFLAATAAPALATECSAPIPPEITVNGSTATLKQMKDAIADFKTFQSASDDYQDCLGADLDAKKQAAAKEKDPKPLDPAIISAVNAKIQANQAEKVKLGGELNTQIVAYKQAHSGK